MKLQAAHCCLQPALEAHLLTRLPCLYISRGTARRHQPTNAYPAVANSPQLTASERKQLAELQPAVAALKERVEAAKTESSKVRYSLRAALWQQSSAALRPGSDAAAPCALQRYTRLDCPPAFQLFCSKCRCRQGNAWKP